MKQKFLKHLLCICTIVILLFVKARVVNAQTPQTFSYVNKVLSYARDVAISGDNAYVAAGYEGVYSLDISDLGNISILDQYSHQNTCSITAIDVDDSSGYATQTFTACDPQNGLFVLDVSNPNALVEENTLEFKGPGSAEEIEIVGDYVYIANNQGGLLIIDMADQENPETYQAFNNESQMKDLKVVGNHVFLADQDGYLWVVDVTDPENPVQVNKFSFPGNGMGIDVEGDYAYVANGSAGLRIFDISDLGNISEVALASTSEYAIDVEVAGNYAFVAAGSSVYAFDVSDPANPDQVAIYGTPSAVYRLTVWGNYVFVGNIANGLLILKFSGDLGGKQLSVPMFKQAGSPWGGQEYDAGYDQSLWCGNSMSQCGCATTSIAMLLKYYGVFRDPYGNPTTPETVNNYFKKGEVCKQSGCASTGYMYGNIRWSAAGKYSADSNKVYSTQKIVYLGPSGYTYQTVFSEIENDRPVILRAPGPQHWVIATGIVGSTFAINDPGFDRLRLDDPAYGNYGLALRSFQKTASDYSSFEITSLAPTQILVTDDQGNKTGFDPETGLVVEDIPHSFYTFEESYADATNEDPTPQGAGVYTVLILTPQQGDYEVEIISQDNELYSFSIHASDRDANVDLDLFEDVEGNGEDHIYTFSYSPEPGNDSKFSMSVPIDVRPTLDRNFINLKSRSNVPVAILSTEAFNAGDVDQSSLTFGRVGDENSFSFCQKRTHDVNSDGRKDLTCFFRSSEMGFDIGEGIGEIKGILRGEIKGGLSVWGEDLVVIR